MIKVYPINALLIVLISLCISSVVFTKEYVASSFGIIGSTEEHPLDISKAFSDLAARISPGDRIIFDQTNYYGNLESTKPLELDFRGATIHPYDLEKAVILFRENLLTPYLVARNSSYGDTFFTVNSADNRGIDAGSFGVLYDGSARPSDGQRVNYELVRVRKRSGQNVYVEDMLRSDQIGSNIRFYPVDLIDSPKVLNCIIEGHSGYSRPCLWFYGCKNTVVKNVQVNSSVGHAIRHEFVHNWRAENIEVREPASTKSGAGYGLTALRSRDGLGANIRGHGCRHIVDFSSSYNCHVQNVVESYTERSGCVVLAHNGFGGNNSVDGLRCTVDGYAVYVSAQGISPSQRAKRLLRDCRVENIHHIVPNKSPSLYNATCHFGINIDGLIVRNLNLQYSASRSILPKRNYLVRIDGDAQAVSIRDLFSTPVRSAVWVTPRTIPPRISLHTNSFFTSKSPSFLVDRLP